MKGYSVADQERIAKAMAQALRIGADDYVVKPFNPVEVVARVKAVLRRSGGEGANGVLRVGPVEIDTTAHMVRAERGEVTIMTLCQRPLKTIASKSHKAACL